MIRIITDSTCDISKEEALELNIEIMPISIYFDEIEYKDGVNLSKNEFYSKLEECETLPKTSAINPYEFEEKFRKYIEEGDDILCILISQELSGTYQSAVIAASEYAKDRIKIVDSRTTTIGMALLIKVAVKLREQNYKLEYISTYLNRIKNRVKLLGIIDTLKYLKIGGRLSSTNAFVGEILGIHPIITIYNGKIESLDKCRSLKSGLKKIVEYIDEYPVDYKFDICYGHSNNTKKINETKDFMNKYILNLNTSIHEIGLAVGTHSGPGLVCIAYIEKEKN